jgi:hypothetical protein
MACSRNWEKEDAQHESSLDVFKTLMINFAHLQRKEHSEMVKQVSFVCNFRADAGAVLPSRSAPVG